MVSRPGGQVQTHGVFKAVADPTRRAILDRLVRGPRSVSDLTAGFSMSQPAISQHLKVLRDAGLVEPERRGRQRLYHLQPDRLREVYDWVQHYQQFWEDRLDALGQLLDEETP